MNHSFNVEIATRYGIEKAVLLENFYFWVKKNYANKRNIHNGKAYTYNSAEAYSELFPYISPRKIAQLLREMETDGLLISGQFNKFDRTKSYTLSDFALSLFQDKTIQNSTMESQNTDNPLSENGDSIIQNSTMEDTETQHCLNTDINTDINTDTHTDMNECAEHSFFAMSIGELQNEMYDAVTEHNKRSPPEKKIAVSPSLLGFCQKEFREMLDIIGIDTVKNSPQIIISALRNYLEVAGMNSWKKYFSLRSFFRNYLDFVPEFFAVSRYIDETKDSSEPGKRPQDLFYFAMKDNPRFDASIFRRHWDDWIKTRPNGEDYFKWQEKWEDVNAY